MQEVTCSVVICAYTEERWDDLKASIDAVRTQSIPPQQLVVVIDHNDQMLERVQAAYNDLTVIANTEQRGLSGARNSGVRAAWGDIIVFLDDDALPIHDWLQRLRAAYVSPDVMSVGGAIEPMWLTQRPAWLPEEFDWVVGCTYRGMSLTPTPVRNLIGANISFRREVFAEVGGFLNGIGRIGKRPLGGEETELCIRAQRRWPTKVILYQPDAKVQHRVPASRTTWRYFRARCYAEGLSKAKIATLTGQQRGLSSERAYTVRTLPLGFIRSVGEAVIQRDLSGLGRASAIVVGLGTTISGYAVGTLDLRIRGLVRRIWQNQSRVPSTASAK